jgi:hypothetical protein
MGCIIERETSVVTVEYSLGMDRNIERATSVARVGLRCKWAVLSVQLLLLGVGVHCKWAVVLSVQLLLQ